MRPLYVFDCITIHDEFNHDCVVRSFIINDNHIPIPTTLHHACKGNELCQRMRLAAFGPSLICTAEMSASRRQRGCGDCGS